MPTRTYYKCSNCGKIIAYGMKYTAFMYCKYCNLELPNYFFEEPANHPKWMYALNNLWEESDARLKNPEYVLKLKLYGFKVPDRYITDDIKPILEEIEQKKKEDYDKLLREQQKYRVGKAMLQSGKHSKAVKDASSQMKMTPDEFLVLCKEWKNSYQEKHRQYNLTHYPPAKYPD